MAYSISKHEMINYSPDELKNFQVMSYEWVDNLNFTLAPDECLKNPEPYIQMVKALFLENGWQGDGDIRLMWIPPFCLPCDETQWLYTKGIIIWHTKQISDGTSWLLMPKEIADMKLPFC